MQKYLDHPVIRYLIISVTSIIAAVLFFRLGGSLAEISNSDSPIIGITFRAGGALAGALIFFLLSYRLIEKPSNSFRVKVHVTKNPKNFNDNDGNKYTCTGMIFDPETNQERRVPLITRWEAGLLTLNFVDISSTEWIGAEIQNQANQVWRVHYFDPRTNTKEIIDAAVEQFRGQV